MARLPISLVKPAVTERRGTLRLYKIWDAARGERDLPLLTQFDLSLIERFGADCFLLEFDKGETPKFRYFGRNLAREIGRDLTGRPVSEVPRFSLLAHVVANCIGASAQHKATGVSGSFIAAADQHLIYRGILLPFSADGITVDALLGFYRSREGKGISVPIQSTQGPIEQPELPSTGDSRRSRGARPVETAVAGSRSRQSDKAGMADDQSRPSPHRLWIARLADFWHGLIWPKRLLAVLKHGPAIGRAVLPNGVKGDFVLLLARRVEAGRFEVISTASPLFLNLAARVALRKTAPMTPADGGSARLAAARLFSSRARLAERASRADEAPVN